MSNENIGTKELAIAGGLGICLIFLFACIGSTSTIHLYRECSCKDKKSGNVDNTYYLNIAVLVCLILIFIANVVVAKLVKGSV
jgi:hypothetical protein